MSDADLQALREMYEGWAKGDLGTGTELLADDIVFEPFPEGSSLKGLGHMGAYMREFLGQWSGYRIVAEEFIVADDAILVEERHYATGASSGAETTMTFHSIWTFRDGKVVRARWENDRAAAFEAAGL